MHMHNNHEMAHGKIYKIKDFLPLIVIACLIGMFVLFKQIMYGFDIHNAMYDFMGSFFIIFSLFKIINFQGFVEAYSTYDIIAKRSLVYAYMYPFIELVLGVAYMARYQLIAASWITLAVMTISSIGVAYELAQRKQIVCACLGAVFKIPMTYVTLTEDVMMAFMAFVMLMQHYLVT